MTIKLAIADQAPVAVNSDLITVGRDPQCTVALKGHSQIKNQHVVFRRIDNRWVVEVCEADMFYVGGKLPKKAHWISDGDVISLSLEGPAIRVELCEEASVKLAAAATSRSVGRRDRSDVTILPESDPLIPVVKEEQSAKRTKSLSSTVIQIPKSESGRTKTSDDPPSTSEISLSKTISNIPKVPRSDSSSTLRVPLSDDDIPTSSAEIPSKKAGRSSKSDANIPNRKPKTSAQVPILKRNSDEPAPGAPVLKRLSSYEMPVAAPVEEGEEFGGAPKRRRSKSEEAELRWIKSVVTKSVVIGGLVLLVLIGVAEVWKALYRTNF